MATKYKLNESLLDTRHNCAKLERDNFTRQDIMHAVHALTEGCSVPEKRDLVKKLFDRSEK